MQEAMENSDMLDEVHVLSSNSFKGSDAVGNESVFYEKFLLDDLDNYWDELNDRLTVSRMVNDSVIKGIINAVVSESEEKISSKENEIEYLNKKLQSLLDNSFMGNSLSEEYVKLNCIEYLCRLRLAAEDHIQKLKEIICNADVGLCAILPEEDRNEKLMETCERVNSLDTIVKKFLKKATEMYEQQWESEVEMEISAIIIENCVKGLQDKFEKKLYEQRNFNNKLNMNWQEKVNELSGMRVDLDSISRSLSSTESSLLLSHNSLDTFEEWNTSKRKENTSRKASGNHHKEENGINSEDLMLEVGDASQLKHMSREELIDYFKSEMINMRRHHESALHEKTEEIFKLKREFLRERGSSPFKKDHDMVKKKIPEIISRLDDILVEKEVLPVVKVEEDELCILKNSINMLQNENEQLKILLEENKKEIKNLSSQVSDAANQMSLHSSLEIKFLHQIKKFKGDLKDVETEANISNDVHNILLKEVIGENECVMDDLEIEARIMWDVHNIAVGGLINDGLSTINSIILKYFTEKSSLKALLCEKEKTLCTEIEENSKLKEKIASLSKLMKEKEDCIIQGKRTDQLNKEIDMLREQVIKQGERADQLNKEIDMLREHVTKHEVLISNKESEMDLTKQKLNEALQQLQQSELEINKLNGKLGFALNALEETEKQKNRLYGIIEEKEKKLFSSITNEKQQAKQMESFVKSIVSLSKASVNFENKLVENIQRNESRLKILSRQCKTVVQQANMLPKRVLLYKQMLDIKSSNLQKAEAEVDLLGDEVDALLSLLGKIYIALDHYSPVLKHYPGVMETLKLVKRELEGEAARSV